MVRIGDGMTLHINGDATPYTVVSIISANKIVVRRDNVKMDPTIKTQSGEPVYVFTRNASSNDKFMDGDRILIKVKKRWKEIGKKIYFNHGYREYRRDPSF